MSFKPEPEAFAIDAFTLSWSAYQFYAFPPYSVINRMLKKIQQDQAEGITLILTLQGFEASWDYVVT